MKLSLPAMCSVVVVAVAAACSADRSGFDEGQGAQFSPDAAPVQTEAGCPAQCSTDLRSVVRSCDGTTLETCAPPQGCGAAGCVDACTAAAEAQSSLGCEFFMLPPPAHPNVSRSCYAAYVVNSWTTAANLKVEYNGAPADATGAIFTLVAGNADPVPHAGPLKPGEAVVVFLANPPPAGVEENYVACPKGVTAITKEWPNPARAGLGSSFRILADVPVSASSIYPFGGAGSYFPSATLLLPVAGWGKQHVIVSAWGRLDLPDPDALGVPGAQIVASEDETDVTVRPVHDVVGGPDLPGTAAGAPRTYRLAKGQSIQFQQGEDLTGSTVESTKPTAVFGGHSCMYIPSGQCCCETAQQQLPAIAQWGSEYVAVGHRPRKGTTNESSPYRIVAGFEGTELNYDPMPPAGAPRIMAGGEVATFWTDIPFSVRSQDSEHPIYVAEYMTGGNNGFDGVGDPEFVNVLPSGQYLNDYTFYADPTYAESSVVVVRAKQPTGFKDVFLECAGKNIPDFVPVGTSGQFEYARLDLTRKNQSVAPIPGGAACDHGVQHLRSTAPFAATMWGWGSYASYAYPGGTAQRKLVTRPLVVR